jgi:hypothetical protein
MSTQDVTVGDHNYRIGKLPAMTQFHVVRRIGPVLASMGISITEMAASGKSLRNDGDLLSIMGTVSDVVAKMSNEDVEYVIYSCLDVVKRQQGERFMPVMTGRTNFQFQDIGMDTMLRLTVEVLKENLGGFFPVPPGEPNTPTA